MSRIAVIGCGWLGLPLALDLMERGHEVHGTTTQIEKLSSLRDQSIIPYLLRLPDISSELRKSSLTRCDTYVINIPPGRRNPDYAADYPIRISALIRMIKEGSRDPRIIFVSSTGVYENTGREATESSSLVKEEKSVLLLAERLVSEASSNYVILRMAGLAGPGRHPGNWFADKVDIPGGGTPINMVHLTDCVALIGGIIGRRGISGVYNVCADEHPIKQEFYSLMSEGINRTPPIFREGVVPYKIVENKKLKEALGYRYRFSDPNLFFYQVVD